MAEQQTYADAPMTADQVKAVGYADAPMTDAHPWVTAAKQFLERAFPPEKPRVDSNMVTIGGVGIAPEDALMAGQAVANVGGAVRAASGVAAKVAAGTKAVAAQAAPAVKYEVAKTGLESLGVPSPIAIPIAIAVSGYKSGPKGKPTGPVDPAAPHLDRSVPVRPSDLTPEQLAERIKFGTGTPPPAVVKPPLGATAAASAPPVALNATAPAAPAPAVAAPAPVAPPVPPVAPPSPQSGPVAPSPGPSPASAALPDQRALNEAALAIRRQAYQARMASTAAPEAAAAVPEVPTAAAGNVKLSAPETKAFMDLMKRGMSGPDAMKNVLMQRSLVESLGTPAPTAAQTRFPKGQRGKVMSQP